MERARLNFAREWATLGHESTNVVVAIDFTKSNTQNDQDLHKTAAGTPPGPTEYEVALQHIARTVCKLDDDTRFPAYGFGDSTTRTACLFSLQPGDEPCVGLTGVCEAYARVKPHVALSGGTSFAPAIYRACELCAQEGMNMHVLVVLTDGVVDAAKRQETADAIAFAKA